MNWKLRLGLSVPMWIGFALLEFSIALVTLPAVLSALALGPRAVVWRRSRFYPDRAVLAWKWEWLSRIWGNEEDGIDGGYKSIPSSSFPQWRRAQPARCDRRAIFDWAIVRNSTNNLRFYAPWSFEPGEYLAASLRRQRGTFAWQGWRSHLWLAFHSGPLRQLRIGFNMITKHPREGFKLRLWWR